MEPKVNVNKKMPPQKPLCANDFTSDFFKIPPWYTYPLLGEYFKDKGYL